jgi:murein DD-endopeptidase MepM/ murein hydrolase activator NlpD
MGCRHAGFYGTDTMRPAPLIASYDAHRRTKRPARVVALNRWTIYLLATGFALLSAWSLASAWYFSSRDDLALRFLERQANLKRSYEEKIAVLKNQAEEASRTRRVELEQIEGELRSLIARQASLETCHAIVQALVDRAGSNRPGTALPGTGAATPGPASAYAPERSPDPSNPFRLRLRAAGSNRTSSLPDLPSPKLANALQKTAKALDGLGDDQLRVLSGLTARLNSQANLFQTALRQVGLSANGPAKVEGATGGPFIPLTDPGFAKLKLDAENAVSKVVRLRRSVASLPFAVPIDGEIDFSSGYGYRVDPFTRMPAVHSGLDFRAEIGSPVHATGAGQVVTAEYSGAYGNMVEIEHSQGVSSRYAHLSSITVATGQQVRAGTIVGRVGSTGRSTGPHLHYETRIGGETVDPQRFLTAAEILEPALVAIP